MKNAIARIAIASSLLLARVALAQSAAPPPPPPPDSAWVSTGSFRPNQTLWGLNWEISKPVGDFDKYISNVSYRGISFEGRSFIRQNLSIGLSFSYNRFEQTYDNTSYSITNGTVTGPSYRYADMFAIRALGHFYLAKGKLKPYVGAGIGGCWDYAYQQAANLYSSQSNFDFIVDPEVGLLYVIASGGTTMALNLAIRYTYTTAKTGQYNDAQWMSGIVGLTWGY